MNSYTYIRFGQTYGEGAYGDCSYNTCTTTQTASSSEGGSLINGGVAIAGIVTLACSIVLIAVLVRVWRRPGKPQLQEESAEEPIDPSGHGPTSE